MRNWWDNRAMRNQTYRPLPGRSRPNWRWRGTGHYRYVAGAVL